MSNWRIEIIVGTTQGVSSPYATKVVCDEIELFDPEVFRKAVKTTYKVFN